MLMKQLTGGTVGGGIPKAVEVATLSSTSQDESIAFDFVPDTVFFYNATGTGMNGLLYDKNISSTQFRESYSAGTAMKNWNSGTQATIKSRSSDGKTFTIRATASGGYGKYYCIATQY